MRKSDMYRRHIRIFFLMCVVLILLPALNAQNTEKRFTVKLQNATLKEFVKYIEQTTGYSFIYGEEVKIVRNINLDVRNKTLRDILNLAFHDQPVSHKFSGNYILLQKKVQPKPVSRKFTVSGYVTDGTSSETLIGANILESRQQQGTTTNPYGFYSITLPEGETDLCFSYLGYATQQYPFTLRQDTVINIRMKDNAMLQEVLVLSDKTETGIMATQMGASEIPMAQIKNTPGILGEADVMKTIQLMPGIQAGTEGSAGIYVRGGGPDQNLILLDGVPVYNIDHVFGFFSVFTPEAIKKVTLFKSSFPARFGGRLSSVIDVRTNDGDMKKYHGSLSIGLLTSKINLEGPIQKDRTSFNISARRSYLDLIAKPFMPKDEKYSYYFYDINAKINHKFSDRSRLFLSCYNGKDHFSTRYGSKEDDEYASANNYYSSFQDKMNMDWGNTIVSGRWNYIFNNKLFSNSTVAFNNYFFTMGAQNKSVYSYNGQKSVNTYGSEYRSGIRDWSYQIDFDYNPVPAHHIKFGGEYIYHSFRPEIMTSRVSDRTDNTVAQDTLYQNVSNSRIHAHEVSAYAEDNFNLGSRLRLNLGMYFSMFQVQKKTYFSAQPRISARYQLSRDITLKTSYTKMNQYVHLLSSTPISMPTDLWVPVTSQIKPMQAHQIALGGYFTGLRGWEFSAESYYKHMRNVLEYKDGVSFYGSSSGWEEKVEMGSGRAMGIEFMVEKKTGKTTGWISYTLAKSDRKFSKGNVNDGKRFPYKYDRRHGVNLVINHKFSDRIDIGASWVFYTGGTASVAEEVTTIIRPAEGSNDGWGHYIDPDGNIISGGGIKTPLIEQTEYVEHRNNYRLPASHRLNLGVNFNKKTKHGVRTWNISVYNMYNAMNPTFVYREGGGYSIYQTPNGEIKYIPSETKLTKLSLLPCVPSVTYKYTF